MTVFYTVVISVYIRAWSRTVIDKPVLFESTHHSVSILIIARNESEHIKSCLLSIAQNIKSPNVEIVLIDDHSEDDTIQVAQSLELSCLRILKLKDFNGRAQYGHSYKKAGLHYGLLSASHDIILTTDADCEVGPHWIDTMVQHKFQTNASIVTGPIHLSAVDTTVLTEFQEIEMMGTMAGTLAGISYESYQSANAANMIFNKDEYLAFLSESDNSLASGDDMFFVQYMASKGRRISFVLNQASVVKTNAMTDLASFANQRIRWATKTKAYKDIKIKIFMALIFLFHVSMLGALGFAILLVSIDLILLFIIQFGIKVLVDYRLLNKTSEFFNMKLKKRSFGPMVLLHVIYVVSMGVFGLLLSEYTWKGRRVT